MLSDVQPYQSSFETKDIERVLKTDDPWFRPVDIKAGPDGCIYVADMYEQRIDHSSHYAGRIDRASGRIYRLKSRQQPVTPQIDYGKKTSAQLLDILKHPSRWHRQTANRLLIDRHDTSLSQTIMERIQESSGQDALEYLWALNASEELSDAHILELLKHGDPFVRAWTVRLTGDRNSASEQVSEALKSLASAEGYIEVRKQLASSAKRLPTELALAILGELMKYNEDATDIHQPLLVWWALESHVQRTEVQQILAKTLNSPEAWKRPMVQQVILERMMKRYASTGAREDLISAAVLLKSVPDQPTAEILLKGFEEAFQGRSLAGIPDELAAAIAESGGGSLALRLRQRQPDAVEQALLLLADTEAKPEERRQVAEVLGQTGLKESLPVLMTLAQNEPESPVLSALLTALQSFDEPRIADVVITRLPQLKEESRLAGEALLSSRSVWSTRLVDAVNAGQVAASLISEQTLRRMLIHQDSELKQKIEEQWGEVAGASTAQMQAEISRVSNLLTSGSGNPKQGKALFMQNCGRCHLLFEEGGRIGPDLTPFARDNTERMLTNIINPNLEIREGFENFIVLTNDGRVLNGFLADKDNQIVILRGVDGQNVILQKTDIEEMKAVPQSVMPEGSLKTLNDQQLRDLFAYLRSSQPVNY